MRSCVRFFPWRDLKLAILPVRKASFFLEATGWLSPSIFFSGHFGFKGGGTNGKRKSLGFQRFFSFSTCVVPVPKYPKINFDEIIKKMARVIHLFGATKRKFTWIDYKGGGLDGERKSFSVGKITTFWLCSPLFHLIPPFPVIIISFFFFPFFPPLSSFLIIFGIPMVGLFFCLSLSHSFFSQPIREYMTIKGNATGFPSQAGSLRQVASSSSSFFSSYYYLLYFIIKSAFFLKSCGRSTELIHISTWIISMEDDNDYCFNMFEFLVVMSVGWPRVALRTTR